MIMTMNATTRTTKTRSMIAPATVASGTADATVDADVNTTDQGDNTIITTDTAAIATSTATAAFATVFDKYKTYMSYDTKEKNSTIGHNETKQEKEKYELRIRQQQQRNIMKTNDRKSNSSTKRISFAEDIVSTMNHCENENGDYDDNKNDDNPSPFSYEPSSPTSPPSSPSSFQSSPTRRKRGTFRSGSVRSRFTTHTGISSPTSIKKGVVTMSTAEKRATGMNFTHPSWSESFIGNGMDDLGDEDLMEELAQKGMIHTVLASMRDRERLPLSEDVYAFIIVCPLWSWPFWYAIYCILMKYVIYGILLSSIENDGDYEAGIDKDTGDVIEPDRLVQVVKFFLIPVAVAMQDDLMTVFANIANKEYDATVVKYTKSATLGKFILSNTLRLIDGFLSLGVNFGVMLMTNTILGIFLNFAALHFLQYIDDVFYDLVEQGFLGDSMEYVTNLCKQVTFKRRFTYDKNGDEDVSGDSDDDDDDDDNEMTKNLYESWSNFITNLDTILMSTTLLVCLLIYGIVQGVVYAE